MKKTNRVFYILTVIAVFCCAGLAFSASAAGETYTENGYTYTVNNGTATITAVDDTVTGDVVIPETLGGYTVTGIGAYAFKDNWNVTSVTISNSVFDISDGAFYSCHKLQTAVLPNNIVSLPNDLFNGCLNLVKVDLPDGIVSLPDHIFDGCYKLTDFVLPQGLEHIGNSAFYYCIAIQNLELPDSLKSIGDSAFSKCKKLETIVLSNNIETIGNHAFDMCSSLTDISIPDSVISIGQEAFNDCDLLKTVDLGSGLQSIGEKAFYSCDKMTSYSVDENNLYFSVDSYGALFNKNKSELIQYPIGNVRSSYTIPEGVLSIDIGCFYSADEIVRISIPEGVKTIADKCFSSMNSLRAVTLPSTVEYIGTDAFSGCSDLTAFYVDADNKYYSSDSNHALLDKEQTTLYNYPAMYTATEYTLPDTVKTIKKNAFLYIWNLKKVIIPDSVETIEEYAFNIVHSISEVEIGAGVSNIGECAFEFCTIQKFKVSDNNLHYSSDEENVLYNKDKTVLIKYPERKSADIFVVPDTVETIAERAFSDVLVKNVVLPKSAAKISMRAFGSRRALESVVILNPDADISDNEYGVTIEGSTTIYGYPNSTAQAYAEKYNKNFVLLSSAEFEFNDGVLTLTGENVIEPTDELKIYSWLPYAEETEIIVFNGVTQVGSNAFSGFANADTIIVNSENIVIDSKAFDGCEKVRTIVSFADCEVSVDSFPDNAQITYYTKAGKIANVPSVSFTYDEEAKTVTFNGDVSVTSNDFFNLLAAVCYGYQDKEIGKLRFSRFTAEDFQFIYYKSRYEIIRKNTIEEAEFTVEIDSETGEKQQISFNELCEGIGNDEITKFHLVATDKDNSNFDNNDVSVGEENIFIRWAKALLALITRIFKLFENLRK